MTATNPHPLANPLNDRLVGNINWSKMAANRHIKIAKNGSSEDLQVPDPSFSYESYLAQQSQLHVPNQEPDEAAKLPMRGLDFRSYGKVWNDRETMSLSKSFIQQQLNASDLAYQQQSQIENAKLCAEMTDEQKDMLAHIEDYLGRSNLVEESEKHGN